jgi:HAE1 family hydrophobic/amphiphilic exporter-1
VRVVTDRSSEVRRALLELAAAALLGMLLGTLVLRYFLAAWRPTLALAVVIPIALLVSFSIFHLLDVPLDVISLAGLALATGLLVDNSIVVLESIHNARAEGAAEPVLSGTRAIAIAVISSSATLLIIFAPLLYLQGLARAIFGEQAVAVIASVSASVILSLTLTPVLAGTRGGTAEGRHPGRRHYLALLDAIATRPRAAVLVAVLITSIGIAGAVLLRRELFAASPVRQVVATFRVSPQLSVDAARATASALSIALLRGADRNELEGASVTYISAEGRGDVVLQFRTAAAAERVLERVRRHAVPLPGAIVDVRSRPSAFLESIGGNADQVEVIASAPTGAEADALAARITSAATSRGLAPVVDLARRGEPDFVLQWDEPRLASAGTTRRAAEEDVRAALGELDLGQTTAGAETRIRLLPVSPRRLDVVPVRVGSAVVPLAAVARIGSGSAARIVDHDDGRPARHLVFRRSAAGWPAVPLGAREHLRFAGHAAELQAANRELLLAAVLAAILLYLTVAAFYESLLLPFIVMLAIPFAAAGAIGGLLLFAQSLNIMSMIGLLFLSGIVVNHSVIFLDRVEMLRRAGVAEDEALRRAVTDRFRPVIMTTLTALLGMLPLALLGGDGVELRRPIAIVIIAGLITATCGTLLLLPLLHRAAERWRSHG